MDIGGGKEEKHLEAFSDKRKRKVDAHWEEMQNQEKEYNDIRKAASVSKYFGNEILLEQPLKRRKRQMAEMLQEIFGNGKTLLEPISDDDEEEIAANAERIAQLRADITASLNKIKKKTVVTETRKFAGQNVMYVYRNYH
jgi:cell division septum initiation protein DivIVA